MGAFHTRVLAELSDVPELAMPPWLSKSMSPSLASAGDDRIVCPDDGSVIDGIVDSGILSVGVV